MKQHQLIILGSLLAVLLVSGGYVMANAWKGPGLNIFPPNNGNVQLLGASGNDEFGDHHARTNVNVNGKRIYNISTNNNATAAALAATSTGYAIGGSFLTRGAADGIQATSSSLTVPTVKAKNTGAGYGLFASTTMGYGAFFGQYMQLAGKKATVEFPGNNNNLYVGWQPAGVTAAATSLYWGDNMLCDVTKVNCGRFSVSTGDNLGNHIADHRLDMNNFRIINLGNDVSSAGVQKESSLDAWNNYTYTTTALGIPTGLSSTAQNYFGVYAQTDLKWGTTIQTSDITFPGFFNGAQYTRPVVFKSRIYWGSRQFGTGNFLLTHSGLQTKSGNTFGGGKWSNTKISASNICSGISNNFDVAALGVYQDKLYSFFTDNSQTSHRLYTTGSTGNSCTQVSGVEGGYLNKVASLESYKDKLYALTADNSAGGCRLLNYNGTSWNTSATIGSFGCIYGSKLMAHDGLLYIMAETDTAGIKIYTYDGSAAPVLINPSQGINSLAHGTNSTVDSAWTWYGKDLYVGTGDYAIYKYNGTSWAPAYIDLPAPTGAPSGGAVDIAFINGTPYVFDWQGGGGAGYRLSSGAWVSTPMGYRSGFHRGNLIAPQPSLMSLTYTQPTAALGYSAGSSYGINAWSLAGPGARLFGKTQLMTDPDVRVSGQLVLGAENNRLAAERATSSADTNLYWGDKLLCDATKLNCGWATSGGTVNSLWDALGSDAYTDMLVTLGHPQTTARQKLDLVPTSTVITTVTSRPIVNPGGITSDGSRLYTTYSQSGPGNLTIYDLSDPESLTPVNASPKPLTSIPNQELKVAGHYAFVGNSNNGFQVVDVSNLTLPVKNITLPSDNTPVDGLYISGTYLYAVTGQGLYVLDIHDPLNPVVVGTLAISGTDIYVQGSYAYITRNTAGLRIVDISNSAIPVSMGTYDPGSDKATKVIVRGTVAYVAFDSSGFTSTALYAIDVADVANPSLINKSASIVTNGNDLKVAGKYAYISGQGAFNRIFTIFDIESPQTSIPIMLSYRLDSLSYFDLENFEINGNYIYGFGWRTPSSFLNVIKIPSANLQTTSLGLATLDSLLTAGIYTAGNLYVASGLYIGGNLTINNGPLISTSGSIQIGNTVLTKNLLNQLKTWLATP